MHLFSLIVVVIFVPIPADSHGFEWIVNLHPGLASEYFKQLKDIKAFVSSLDTLFLMETKRREHLCKDVAKAIVFQYQNEDEPWQKEFIPVSDFDYASSISEIASFYEEGSFPSVEKSTLIVPAHPMIIFVYAIPCSVSKDRGEAWFLAAGFDDDNLLVLTATEQNSGNQRNTIIGLAEPSPLVSPMNPETSFLRDLKSAAGDSRTRSVCSLSAVQKFRLCNSAFHVYMGENNARKIYAVNYVRGVPRCLENTRISFTSSGPMAANFDNPVQVDLLRCVMNQESSSPQIYYVTADPKTSLAVYVVESRPASDDISSSRWDTEKIPFSIDTLMKRETGRMSSSELSKNYFIVMHIYGISALRYEPS